MKSFRERAASELFLGLGINGKIRQMFPENKLDNVVDTNYKHSKMNKA